MTSLPIRVHRRFLQFLITAGFYRQHILNSVRLQSFDEHRNKNYGVIFIKYDYGSNAMINYFSNCSKSYSKERNAVHQQNSTQVLDNWWKLTCYRIRACRSKSPKQEKGHFNQFKQLLESVEKASGPTISWEEVLNTSKVTLAAIDYLIVKKRIKIHKQIKIILKR